MLIVETIALLFSGLSLNLGVITPLTNTKTQNYYSVSYDVTFNYTDLCDYLIDENLSTYTFMSFSCTGVDFQNDGDVIVETSTTYENFPYLVLNRYTGDTPIFTLDVLRSYRTSNVNISGYVKTTLSDYSYFNTLVAGDDTNILNLDMNYNDYDQSSTLFIHIDFIATDYTFYVDNTNTYSTGYDVGYDVGYDNGKQDGVAKGFSDGYDKGREDYENSDTYINSIFNGILSIGLIPIEFFMSIFNFEILGINITSLISAFLTIMLIIILMRLILGGKKGD